MIALFSILKKKKKDNQSHSKFFLSPLSHTSHDVCDTHSVHILVTLQQFHENFSSGT